MLGLTRQSDFGATHSTTPSALGGMDMELPSEYYCETIHFLKYSKSSDQVDGKTLLKAVKNGHVPMKRLDDMAHR